MEAERITFRGTPLFTMLADARGRSLKQRANEISDRLNALFLELGPGHPVKVTATPAGDGIALELRPEDEDLPRPLTVVYPEDAAVESERTGRRVTVAELAQQRHSRIQHALDELAGAASGGQRP